MSNNKPDATVAPSALAEQIIRRFYEVSCLDPGGELLSPYSVEVASAFANRYGDNALTLIDTLFEIEDDLGLRRPIDSISILNLEWAIGRAAAVLAKRKRANRQSDQASDDFCRYHGRRMQAADGSCVGCAEVANA